MISIQWNSIQTWELQTPSKSILTNPIFRSFNQKMTPIEPLGLQSPRRPWYLLCGLSMTNKRENCKLYPWFLSFKEASDRCVSHTDDRTRTYLVYLSRENKTERKKVERSMTVVHQRFRLYCYTTKTNPVQNKAAIPITYNMVSNIGQFRHVSAISYEILKCLIRY